MNEPKTEEQTMNERNSTYDKFLELRAATVESIALAWSEKALSDEYRKDPIGFMREYLGYEFPFKMKLEIEEATTSDEKRRWLPQETGGWVGPNNTLEMILPPKPKDEKHEAIALSVYNAKHLTMFNENDLTNSGDQRKE